MRLSTDAGLERKRIMFSAIRRAIKDIHWFCDWEEAESGECVMTLGSSLRGKIGEVDAIWRIDRCVTPGCGAERGIVDCGVIQEEVSPSYLRVL